jgi:hypothetical protein
MNVGPPIHLYMCTFARGLSTHTHGREREREFPSAEWMETAESSKKASRMPSRTLALPRQEEKEKKLLIDSILADVDEPRLPPMVRLCDESSRDLNLSSRFAIHRL